MTLKAARANKGYSLEVAAEKIKVSPKTLASYEHGRTFPKATTIMKMEQVYGVKYDDLVFLPSITV